MKPAKVGRRRTRRGPRGKLAEALREARKARGLSQHAAAADLAIPQSALGAWESGARRPSGLALRYLVEVWIPESLERAEGAER